MDLTNINDYIEREQDVLHATLFAGGDTAQFARYMTGIKGSTEVPQISGTAKLQAGNCPAPSGGHTGDLVTIKVNPFTVYEMYCQDDFQEKFPNTVLAPGSNNADTPKEWEEALIDANVASIAEQLEMAYWQGDTAGSDYTLFDGFIKMIDAEAEVIEGNTGAVSVITKDNVKDLVEGVRIAAPAKVKRDSTFTVVVGDDTFDKYIAKEKEDNMYHYKPEHDNGTYRIGGSGATLQRVYGLDGTDRMFASVGRNFVVGSDVKDEESALEMWYDKTSDKTYLRVKGKAGVQIVNPEEIVEFTLGA
jgi:hypothetical protein